MTMHRNPVANLDCVPCPALSDQFHRAQAASIPDGFFTALVNDVDVVADVRISEPDFGDDAFDRRRVVAIEFCGVGMVGEGLVADEAECSEQREK